MKHLYYFLSMTMLLLPSGNIYAAIGEEYHEVLGGFNMLRSTLAPLNESATRGGMGFGAGAGYAYHFNAQMSFQTGLEINSYSGTSVLKEIHSESNANVSPWGENWFSYPEDVTNPTGKADFQISTTDYSVVQSALYLQVPLLFGYEDAVPGVDWLTWYAHGGFKLGYSLSGSSRASVDSIMASLNIPEYGYPLENGLETLLGVGTNPQNYPSMTQKLNLGFSSIGYLEVGLKQLLMEQYNFYVGIFGEYSLYSALAGGASKDMYEYKASADVENPFNVTYTAPAHTTKYQGKTSYPLSFGICLRFSFDTKRQISGNSRMLQMRFLDF